MVDVARLLARVSVEGVSTAQGELRAFDKGLRDATGGLVSLGTVGGLAMTAVAAGAVKMATDTMAAATSFEAQMDSVAAKAAATAEEAKALAESALDLGPAWGKGATEVGKAQESLIKGGVSVADAMAGATEAVITLASASGEGMTLVADTAANASKVFGIAGRDMAHVADVLAGAANATTADVSDFSMALSMASAVAKQASQSFDDTVTALALMAEKGIKNSDAGTSLKQMLLSLTGQSKQAKDEMRALGIITADGANRFYDAAGQTKSLAEISQVLQDALAGLSDAQRTASLQVIFGSDAIRAATVMANAGAEGYRRMYEEIGKTSALEVAKARMDNMAGSMSKLTAEWERYQIVAGQQGIPTVRGLVDTLTDLLHSQNEMHARTQRTNELIAAGVPAFQAATLAAKGVNRETAELVRQGMSVENALRMESAAASDVADSYNRASAAKRGFASQPLGANMLPDRREVEGLIRAIDRVPQAWMDAAYASDRADELARGIFAGDKDYNLSGYDGARERMSEYERQLDEARRKQQSLASSAERTGEQLADAYAEAVRQLQRLNDEETLNLSIAARRKAFDERQSAEDRTRGRLMDMRELYADYSEDMASARTRAAKANVQKRFDESMANMKKGWGREDSDIVWRAQQDAEAADFEGQLSREALARQRADVAAGLSLQYEKAGRSVDTAALLAGVPMNPAPGPTEVTGARFDAPIIGSVQINDHETIRRIAEAAGQQVTERIMAELEASFAGTPQPASRRSAGAMP